MENNKNKTLPTLQKFDELLMSSFGDVVSAIQFFESFKHDYPERPARPFLNTNHSSEIAFAYAKLLKEYEGEYAEYLLEKQKYEQRKHDVNALIEKAIKSCSGFDNYIPDGSKDKVWTKAWDDGHSAGWYQVYLELHKLVQLFDNE